MKINDKQGYNIKIFARDIRQWVYNIVTKYRTDGIFIKINFMENLNISSNNIQLNKYCGICMDRLDLFGIDYSLRCLHVLCWCCILRLRYLLNLRECPFCKHSVNKILITSNIQYLRYIVNNSLDFGEKNEFYPKFVLSINDKLSKKLSEDEVDSILFNEKIGIYFESFVSRWTIERIMEVRCWIPKCRPKYLPLNKNKNKLINDLKFLLGSSDNFKTIKELGDHIFRYHNLKCCFVCIEKRHTMLLPEHMLYEINDISRHMKKGEPWLQPPIFPHILCPVCRIWCLDKDDFTDHVKNEHFSCNICEQRIMSNFKDLNEDNNDYIFSKKRIKYVYSDYNSLQNHWRDEHYPCDNEDCMFIVFENESELIDHKATCHSRNRWNNIQIPILINYTNRSEIQYRNNNNNNNNNNNIPLMNFSDIETPTLCLSDELCNEIIKKLRNDQSFLWRNILLHDLTRCIKIITEELEITLGLKEKCNDFSFWSLEMINNLFISNDIIINGIKKIGILYKDNKISPISFLLEIIFLIWGNLNITLPKRSLQDLKKQFGNIATAPNTIRIFFSCIPDPINILGIDGINYTKVSYQQMENILVKEINWSLLYSDINTMILISLILGLSDIEQRSKLINGIRIFKDAIENQSIIIIPSKNPRFSLSITEELKPYIFKKDEELVLNNKIVKEMKYICLEKFIQPNQMLLTSGTSFLVAISSFFEIIWPKVQMIEEIFNYLLNNEDKEKLDRQFLILCSSQTINELNTLALLYQHTISITSSATVAEKILGLRAPYYRLAASLSDERNNNMKSDSLSLRQWWNLCVKTFNKVNITDIEVIMIYCQCCLKILNNCIKDNNPKDNISNVKNYNSVIKVDHNEEPKTVIASSEIIYTPLKSNSIKFSQFNKGKNTWFSKNTSSYFNQNLNLSKISTSANTTSTQILSNSSSYASKVKVNIDRTLKGFSEEKDFELEKCNNELFNKEKKFPVLLSNNKKNSKSKLLSWKCSLCTYENLPSRNRCLMCNIKK